MSIFNFIFIVSKKKVENKRKREYRICSFYRILYRLKFKFFLENYHVGIRSFVYIFICFVMFTFPFSKILFFRLSGFRYLTDQWKIHLNVSLLLCVAYRTPEDIFVVSAVFFSSSLCDLFSFLARGFINALPVTVWESIKNPTTRFVYDNMLKVKNIKITGGVSFC